MIKLSVKEIDAILEETSGIILYNEQFIMILLACGYSFEDANIIRKAYGKRLVDKVREFECSLKINLGEATSKYLIYKIRRDIDYSINKSHLYAMNYKKEELTND